ncbi:MAG TPA: hypothetical protein VFD47_08895 [Actinomycetota bacterium]|nr:hypothetical protein [Actinomycetota bacterium]
MTENKSFKRRVRERVSKTGESYTAARGQVAQKRDRVQSARARLAATDERMSDAKIQEATGKKWDRWFAILDRWGARDKKHGEIARFLIEKHEVAGWWAQTISVYYERDRGMRMKHQNSQDFSVSASKTIAVPVDVLFDAFVDSRKRKKWLTDGAMTLRTSQPERTARFNWEDGSTRVNIGFTDKGPSKATVSLAHERLADADEAETAKTFWKERLAERKSFLES